MTAPSGGALIAQGPVGLFAPRSRSLLGLQSDPQEGGRMQRVGRVGFAFDQSRVEFGFGGSQ